MKYLILSIFALFSFTVSAQPSNDTCAGSQLLTVSAEGTCDLVSASSIGATQTFPEIPVEYQSNYTTGEVWYHFVAPASGIIGFGRVGDGTNIPLWVLYGGSCGSLQMLGTSYGYQDLIPGDTYYLMVWSYPGNSVFDICIPELSPASNNDCNSAISVVSNPIGSCASELDIDNLFATSSGMNNSCKSDISDLWYSFTANSDLISIARLSGFGNHTLWSGSCGALTEVGCDNYSNSYIVTNGNSYYLQITYDLFPYYIDASYCISGEQYPKSGDDCSIAESIIPSSSTSCNVSSRLLFDFEFYNDSTTDEPTCASNDSYVDRFWSFQAPASGSVKFIPYNNMSEVDISFYSGSCGSLQEVTCYSDDEEHVLTNLTVGDTYYLRAYYQGEYFTLSRIFCLLEGPPPPSNNDCSGAISLSTTSCNIQSPDMTGAFETSIGSCESGNIYDVWYEITTPNSGEILSLNGESSTDRTYTIYDNNCGSLTEVFCATATDASIALSSLNASTTYLLKVSVSDNLLVPDFCVTVIDSSPPANDDCIDAIHISSPSTSWTGTTQGASQSSEVDPPCGDISNSGGDVWFTVNAPTGGSIKMSSLSGSTAYSFTLYSGTCGSLVPLQCHTDVSTSSKYVNGLVVGQTYYVRMWHNGPNAYADINAKGIGNTSASSPVNDDCSDATTKTIPDLPSSINLSTDFEWANTDYTQIPTCGDYNGGDLWYEVITNETGNLIGKSNGSAFTLYSGTCANLIEIDCQVDLGSDDDAYLSAAPNTTYLMQVYDVDYDFFDYRSSTIKFGPATPTNDNCSGAIAVIFDGVECSDQIVDASFATASSVAAPVCASGIVNDVWFTMTPTTTSFSVSHDLNYSYDVMVALYSGGCSGLTLISCIPANDIAIFSDLTPNTPYILRLWNEGELRLGETNLCFRENLEALNLDCSNAQPMTVESTCINYTGVSMQGEVDEELWYSFVAPTSGAVNIECEDCSSSIRATFYGQDCGAIAEISYANNVYNNGAKIQSLIAGDTYYFVLSKISGYPYIFDICLTESISEVDNDNCVNPEIISLISGENSSTYNAEFINSTTYQISCGAPGAAQLWYQIETGESGNLKFTHQLVDATGGKISIMSGTCDDLNVQGCITVNLEEAETEVSLTPNTSYFLLMSVASATGPSPSMYFSMEDVLPPAINDLCASATSLSISLDDSCSESVEVNTVAANDDASDCLLNSEELWYVVSPSESGAYGIKALNNGVNISISLYEGSCGSIEVTCATNELVTTLEGGLDYYIAIASTDLSTVTFDLCVYNFESESGENNIGINVAEPIQNLHVKNGILLGNTDVPAHGSIRFTGADFEGFTSDGWTTLTGAPTIVTDNLGDHTATTGLNMSNNQITNVATPIASTDAATKSYVDAHADGDASTTNEKISSMVLTGSTLFITEDGTTSDVDLSSLEGDAADDLGNHTATQSLDMAGQKIEGLATPTLVNDAATKAYVDAHVDGDASATNETITSIILNATTLSINEAGTTKQVDLSTLAVAADDLGNHTATMDLDMDGQKIVNVDDPVASTDAVNKGWVESLPQLWNLGTNDELYYDDGFVAINKATADYSLDVDGTIRSIRNSTSDAIPHLLLTSTTASNPARLKFETDGVPEEFWLVEAKSSASIESKFSIGVGGQSSATRFLINGAGEVGVNTGTTNLLDRFSIFSDSGESPLHVKIEGSTKLRILSNGGISLGSNNTNVTSDDVYIHDRLGVGVASPATELDVDGRIQTSTISSATDFQLNLIQNDDGFARLNMTNTSGKNFTIGADLDATTANSRINFNIEDLGNILTLDGSRRVGIFDPTPESTLEMNAASGDDPMMIRIGANEVLQLKSNGHLLLGNNTTDIASRWINTSTGAYLSTGGTWTNASSRTLKTNFERVSSAAILAKISALEILRWSYKSDSTAVHLGPIAEDFHAAFGLGHDNVSIATVDADGVALAAIQALIEENKILRNECEDQKEVSKTLRVELQNQKNRLDILEDKLNQLLKK